MHAFAKGFGVEDPLLLIRDHEVRSTYSLRSRSVKS